MIAVLATLAGLYLVFSHNGLIAWFALLGGVLLLGKIWRRPTERDLALSLGLILVPVLLWAGTYYYVISSWESGEVVELEIQTSNGSLTARLWVMDIGPHPVVYYDALPEVAQSLLAGHPLRFNRAGQISIRVPQATPVEALGEEQANRIMSAMQNKYGALNDAAVLYYLMLGRAADRVALVATLVPATADG